jgi:hypothetical protein
VHEAADGKALVLVAGNDSRTLANVDAAIAGTKEGHITFIGHGIDGVGQPSTISAQGLFAAVNDAKATLAARGVEATRVNLLTCYGGCSTGIAEGLHFETGLTVRAALGPTSWRRFTAPGGSVLVPPKFIDYPH